MAAKKTANAKPAAKKSATNKPAAKKSATNKPAAKKSATNKPVATKAAAPPSIALSVPPKPLPPPASGDVELDALARDLATATPASVEASTRFRTRPKDFDGAHLAALLVDAALDYGEVHWDDAVARTLPTKERRAYQAAFDAAYSGRGERAAWLGTIMGAAVHHDAGAARVAEIARGDADWAVREIAARALLGARPDDARALDAIATLWDLTNVPNEVAPPLILGARAINRRDRAAAFDRLAPLVDGDRGALVVQALIAEAPRIDPRWLDRLLPILGTNRMDREIAILMLLPKLDPVPRMLDAILRYTGDPAKVTFVVDPTLVAIAHVADARATPFLLRALAVAGRKDLVLEAMRRAADPATGPALRAWIEEQRASQYASSMTGLIDVAEGIVRNLAPLTGAAAVAPVPDLDRRKRSLTASNPREPPPEVPIAKQRKDLDATFAKARVPHGAELARPSIRLFSTRADDDSIEVGASKLGGRPDLPAGMEWPREGAQIFSFVAQLRMDEFAPLDASGILPKKGLLSFFVQDEFDEPHDFLGAAKVFLFDAPLVRASVPDGFDRRPAPQVFREPFAACTLRARALVKLASPSIAARFLSEEERVRYEESVFVAFSPEHQLLGFRDRSYDETPEDQTLLFQCTSDDEAGMEWGDVDEMCFMIEPAALARGDFSRVTTVVGD